jgi:hypothetical protein
MTLPRKPNRPWGSQIQDFTDGAHSQRNYTNIVPKKAGRSPKTSKYPSAAGSERLQSDLQSGLEGFCRRLRRFPLAEEEAPLDLAQDQVLENCWETDEQRDLNLEIPPEPKFLSSVKGGLDGTNLTLTPLAAEQILNQLEEVGESPPFESCKSLLCPCR